MKKLKHMLTIIFLVTASLLATCSAYGQDGIPVFDDSTKRDSSLWFKTRYSATEDSRVKIQDSELALSLEEFDLGARLWRNLPQAKTGNQKSKESFMKKQGPPQGKEENPGIQSKRGFPGIKQLSTSFSYKKRNFEGDAILPASGDLLPEEFYNIKAALTYTSISGRRKLWGLRLGFGSASDEPFHASDLTTTDALFFMSNPVGERDSWMFFVYYSDNRAVLNHVPLPGFAYMWKPGKKFQILAGIPFLATKWKPMEKLDFSLSLNPAPGGKAEVVYSVSDTMKIFGVLQTRSESYIRDERLEYWDRLFYYESQLQAGTRILLGKSADFEISGSYKFDRYIFEGDGYEDRDTNRISLENGFCLNLVLSIRF